MPIVLKEIEVLCNADKIANVREEFNVLYERS